MWWLCWKTVQEDALVLRRKSFNVQIINSSYIAASVAALPGTKGTTTRTTRPYNPTTNWKEKEIRPLADGNCLVGVLGGSRRVF